MGEALITRRGGGNILPIAANKNQMKFYRINAPTFSSFTNLTAGSSVDTTWTFKNHTTLSDDVSCVWIYVYLYASSSVTADVGVILTPNNPVTFTPVFSISGYACTYELTLEKNASGYWVVSAHITNTESSTQKYAASTNIQEYAIFLK